MIAPHWDDRCPPALVDACEHGTVREAESWTLCFDCLSDAMMREDNLLIKLSENAAWADAADKYIAGIAID